MIALALAGLLAASPDVSGTYRIEAPKVLKLRKGEVGHAKVEVVPRSDAHVSPDAPISLSLTAGPGVKLAKEKLARGAGKDEVKGTLNFFICTEKLCEKQKREIAMAVEVQ